MKQLVNCMNITRFGKNGENKNTICIVEKYSENTNSKPKKRVIVEDNPTFSFYVTKPGINLDQSYNFISTDKVDKVTCSYNSLYRDMATLLDLRYKTNKNSSFLDQCINNRRNRDLVKLHKDFNLHMSDMNICDYKIREYLDRYNKDIFQFPLEKSFMDIEVDGLNYDKFPEPIDSPCPISMISYMHEPTRELHSFLLYNEANESQQQFLLMLDEREDEYLEEIRLKYYEEASKIYVHVFEEEIDLIKAWFDLVHKQQPDFCGIWNGHFDLGTINGRLRRYFSKNNDPTDNSPEVQKAIHNIVCHKDFPIKNWYIKKDEFHTSFDKIKHTFDVASYTQYIDLLYIYATLRVSKGKKDSYTLEDICMEELGEGKLEYVGHISEAMYVDFEKFFRYSLMDSYRLFELEKKNNDVELLYGMSQLTYTRLNTVMQKTTSIRNFAAKILFDQGFIISNNRNKFKEETEKVKFRGALVMPPENMSNVGVNLFGKLSRYIFDNVLDQDLTAMYPNLILSGNYDSDTMIGKVFYDADPIFEETISDLLIENNIIDIGNKFLSLPSLEEIIDNLDEYLQ